MKKNHVFSSIMSAAFTLCTAAVIMLTTSGCSSADEALSDRIQNTENVTLCTSQQGETLMARLCVVSTDADGQTAYTPLIGRALEAAAPTVYYCVADSKQQAEARYRNILSSMEEVTGKPVEGRNIQAGDIRLTFTEGNGADETGRITVECPRLKSVLTAIVYIPAVRWPENDLASQINYFSVWRNKKTQNIYACMKPANPDTGYMVCLEDNAPGGYKLATTAALDAMAMTIMDFPHDYQVMFETVKDALAERGGYVHFCNFERLMYWISKPGQKRTPGVKVVNIANAKGYSEYYFNRMPIHRSGKTSKKIYAGSFTFERETRLDANEWECLKY